MSNKLKCNVLRFTINKVEPILHDPHYMKLYLNLYSSMVIITTEAWVEMGQPIAGDSVLFEVSREEK